MTNNFVAHDIAPDQVRFTQSSRKHRIGRARALYVLEHYLPIPVLDGKRSDQSFRWIGKDDRGIEIEIIAVATPQYLLVIHVMPYRYRRK